MLVLIENSVLKVKSNASNGLVSFENSSILQT